MSECDTDKQYTNIDNEIECLYAIVKSEHPNKYTECHEKYTMTEPIVDTEKLFNQDQVTDAVSAAVAAAVTSSNSSLDETRKQLTQLQLDHEASLSELNESKKKNTKLKKELNAKNLALAKSISETALLPSPEESVSEIVENLRAKLASSELNAANLNIELSSTRHRLEAMEEREQEFLSKLQAEGEPELDVFDPGSPLNAMSSGTGRGRNTTSSNNRTQAGDSGGNHSKRLSLYVKPALPSQVRALNRAFDEEKSVLLDRITRLQAQVSTLQAENEKISFLQLRRSNSSLSRSSSGSSRDSIASANSFSSSSVVYSGDFSSSQNTVAAKDVVTPTAVRVGSSELQTMLTPVSDGVQKPSSDATLPLLSNVEATSASDAAEMTSTPLESVGTSTDPSDIAVLSQPRSTESVINGVSENADGFDSQVVKEQAAMLQEILRDVTSGAESAETIVTLVKDKAKWLVMRARYESAFQELLAINCFGPRSPASTVVGGTTPSTPNYYPPKSNEDIFNSTFASPASQLPDFSFESTQYKTKAEQILEKIVNR